MLGPQHSYSADSDYVPTQPMNHEATLGQPNFVALEKGEKFVLNERKAREIKEHLHSQMPLPNNVELQNVEAIKCQCGWNGQEAAMKRGFIRPTPGYKAKGFVRKGLPKFGLVPSDDVYRRMEREIFEPMLKIHNHAADVTPEGPGMIISYEHGSFEKPGSHASTIPAESDKAATADGEPEKLGDRERLKRKGEPLEGNGDESNQLDDLDKALQKSAALASGASDEKTSVPTEVGESDRKRRKISNYPDPIDVGAETTDNESMCV
ncbi:hypothetical protein ATERTT37_005918 [Aspergillus terreus]